VKLSFHFVNAKVRAMRSLLYEGRRVLDLCNLRSVADLVTELVPDYPVTSALALERFLVVAHVKELLRLQQFLYGANAEFFEWLLSRYCLENIKVVVRSGLSGEAPESTRELLVELPPPLALPLDELVAMRASPERLLAMVPSAHLRELLAEAIEAADGDPFVFESALDASYLGALSGAARALPRRYRRKVAQLVGCEIDIANVMLALRARLNYDLDPEAVTPFFVQGGERLDAGRWKGLLEQPSGALAAELMHVQFSADTSSTALEWQFARKLYGLACRIFRTSVLDFPVVAAFFYIKRAELADLLQVVGTLSYGLGSDQLRPRLVTGSQP